MSAPTRTQAWPPIVVRATATPPQSSPASEVEPQTCPVTGESVWASAGCFNDCWFACSPTEASR